MFDSVFAQFIYIFIDSLILPLVPVFYLLACNKLSPIL
ncbi:hypothetical protein T08_578 [Trichinella sp. T8]|nr:hypothetical protein T08_578 [Trichinella sp. T8]